MTGCVYVCVYGCECDLLGGWSSTAAEKNVEPRDTPARHERSARRVQNTDGKIRFLGGGGRGGSRGRHHEKDKRSAGSNPPQDDQTRLNIPSTFVNSSLSQLDLNSLDNQKFVFLSRFTSCLLQSYKCATTTQQDFQVEYQPRASPCNKTQPKIYTQGSDQDWTI